MTSTGTWPKKALLATYTLVLICFTLFHRHVRIYDNDPRKLQVRSVGDHTDVKENLRGLFLGTSRTYGSGLYHCKEAKDQDRLHAFPYKTTNEVSNLAVPGTGPLFPAMCLQSLLGEDLRVDYVVLEFFHIVSGGEAMLLDLALRVRQRFPDAFIIFLAAPIPQNFVHLPTQESLAIRMSRYFNNTIIGEIFSSITVDFIDEILDGTEEEDWEFQLPLEQFNNVHEATLKVGGYLWTPIKKGISTKEQIRNIGTLFFRDASHFNVGGHNRIASEIRQMLVLNNVQRSDRVNEWAYHDDCDTWYQDGHADKLKHSEMKMIDWAGKQKHGLIVSDEGSWFEVTNPTPNQMMLYVYYMATAPEQEYVAVKVTVTNAETSKFECEDQIIPLVSHSIFPDKNRRVHVVEGKHVGYVGNGTFRVALKPIKNPNEEQQPFRVTGIALTETKGGNELWLG